MKEQLIKLWGEYKVEQKEKEASEVRKRKLDELLSNFSSVYYDTNGSHTHCWMGDNPPCGQKIKHFECCLCKRVNPEIESYAQKESEDQIKRVTTPRIEETKKALEQPKCEARWGDNPCGHTATKLLPVNGQMFQLCDACYKITKKQNSLTY